MVLRRLPLARHLSSAAPATARFDLGRHHRHAIADSIQTGSVSFVPENFVRPNLDPDTVILPRQFVESALPPGYLRRLRSYLKSVDLGHCSPEFVAHALIHPEFVREWSPNATLALSWKGLAFLGDAVLYFLTASYLVQTFDNLAPSNLHRKRFAMLNNEALSRLFTSPTLSLCGHLVLSRRMPGRSLPGIQASAMEAFIGAVYLNQGLETSFFTERLIPELCRYQTQETTLDPISRLQILCQRKYRCVPEYRTLSQVKTGLGMIEFEVGVYIGEMCLQQAIGNSLAEARKLAAQLALGHHEIADDVV